MVQVRFGNQTIQVRVDGAALVSRQAALAENAADRSQDAADFAEGFTGPVYASVSAGEAATTPGQIFRVSNGDGPPETTTAYRRTSGGSVVQAPLATTAALASTDPGKGADIPKFRLPATAALTRGAGERLKETISAKDFGAIGDGFNHPLSERFASLGAAQAVYPFVSALSQSLDWAGIQAALNYAAETVNTRRAVRLPSGYYVLSNSLGLPDFVTLEGDSRRGSVLHNQGTPLAAPQIVNQNPASLIGATIRNLSCLGGTHAIKLDVSGEVAGLVVENVSTALQTDANFEANYLQTASFVNCDFSDGGYGFKSTGAVCNSVHLINCRLTNHTESSFYLRGGNLVTLVGGSMEGAGAAGKSTIDIEDAVAVSFKTYFEATHEYLLRSRNCTAVKFDGCTMMGRLVSPGVLGAYKFDCDKEVEFGSNYWHHLTVGPATILLTGDNEKLAGNSDTWTSRGLTSGRFSSHSHDGSDGAAFNLLVFSRPLATAGTGNQQLLTGTLRIGFTGIDSGGVLRTISRVYPIKVNAGGDGNVTVATPVAVAAFTDDNAGSITMTVQPKSGATPTSAALECVMTGVNTAFNSAVQWSFEYQSMSTLDNNNLAVEIG